MVTPSLTFAVLQVGKTVSKADDSIEATSWWLGHIFVQSHPVGFLNDWGPEKGREIRVAPWYQQYPPPPSAVLPQFPLQDTHRDSLCS